MASRKTIYSLALFLLFSVPLKAQYSYYRGLTEIHAGVALPMFDFGNRSSTQLAQHGQVGFNIGAGVSYFYSRNVALEFIANYSFNGINTTSLANAYLETDTLVNNSASATSGSFSDISGVAGFRFNLPVNNYFSFVFKMMGGLRSVYKPEANIQVETIYGTRKYYETSDNQVLFALYSSAGGRFSLNHNMDINFSAAFMGSRVAFEFVKNGMNVTENDHMGNLMLSVGFGYQF